MNPDISVIYALARSGATLISRCLACISNNLLLSEVHPRCAYFHPLKQAYDWYQLVTREEISALARESTGSYIDSVKLVSEHCRRRGKSLIIRDWTHVDFTPGPYPVKPVFRLSQSEALGEHFHIHDMAIVRDPVDTFLSLSKLKNYSSGWLSLPEYMAGYRKFAEIAAEIGYVKYEEFCDKPMDTMSHICRVLEVNYDDQFMDHYSAYRKITGDSYSENQQITLTGEAIGQRSSSQIMRPPRREGWARLVRELEDNADYQRIQEILGYPYQDT